MSNPWENSLGSLLKYEWDEGMIWNNYSELLTIHMWKKNFYITIEIYTDEEPKTSCYSNFDGLQWWRF